MGIRQALASAANYVADALYGKRQLEEWLQLANTSPNTTAGVRITPANALSIPEVYTAISFLSEDFATFPFEVWEDDIRVKGHPYERLLNLAPNSQQDGNTWKQQGCTNYLLYGNHFLYISRNGDEVESLAPIHPSKVRLEVIDGVLVYHITITDSDSNVLESGTVPYFDIIHPKDFSLDGWVGKSRIELLRDALGLTKAAQDYTSTFLRNGPRPGGLIKLPSQTDDKGKPIPPSSAYINEMRDKYTNQLTDVNRFKVAVLVHGMEFEPLTIANDEAQLLELMQHNTRTIASIFKLPSGIFNDTGNTTDSKERGKFLKNFSFPSIVNSWQQELSRKLFPDGRYRIHINMDRLDRLDPMERVQVAKGMGEIGVAKVNQLLSVLLLPLLSDEEGGNRIVTAVNNQGVLPLGDDEQENQTSQALALVNQKLDALQAQSQAPQQPVIQLVQPPQDKPEPQAGTLSPNVLQSVGAAARAAFTRIVERDSREALAAVKKHQDAPGALGDWSRDRTPKLEEFALKALQDVAAIAEPYGLDLDVEELASSYAASSKGQLAAVQRKGESLTECVEGWKETRAEQLTEQLMDSLPKAVYCQGSNVFHLNVPPIKVDAPVIPPIEVPQANVQVVLHPEIEEEDNAD